MSIQERFKAAPAMVASVLPSTGYEAPRPLYEDAAEIQALVLGSTYSRPHVLAAFIADKLQAMRVRADMARERSKRIGEEYEAKLDAAVEKLLRAMPPGSHYGVPKAVLRRMAREGGHAAYGFDVEPSLRKVRQSLGRLKLRGVGQYCPNPLRRMSRGRVDTIDFRPIQRSPMDAIATQARPTKVARQAAPADAANTAAAEAAAPAQPKAVGQISPQKAVLSEAVNNTWRAVAPTGAVPEDLDMADGPFNLLAKDLTLQDDIRVIAADSSWIADFIVVDCGATYALARLTQAINLPTRRSDMSDRLPQGIRIVQAGPADSQPGWLVWRDADGVMLNAGHTCHRKEEAVAFVLNHATVRGDANPRYFGKPATA